MFNKRTEAPKQDNAFYYGDNIFYQSGYGLPNCTCYAWGRWYELLGKKPALCINNAKDWYNYNDGYARSNTPKKGAIGCYDGDPYGHVVVVEEVYNNGTMLISESDWVQRISFRTRIVGQNENLYGYKLQGFILLPISDEDKPAEKSNEEIAETPVVEDTIKVGDKVKVLNAIQYTGETFKTWYEIYDVIEVVNDRAVIGVDGVVTCAINIKDIQKV